MFVKVVGGVFQSLYECKRVHIRQGKNNDFVVFHMEEPEITLELEKSNFVVYFMSDQGRTVDMHRWD